MNGDKKRNGKILHGLFFFLFFFFFLIKNWRVERSFRFSLHSHHRDNSKNYSDKLFRNGCSLLFAQLRSSEWFAQRRSETDRFLLVINSDDNTDDIIAPNAPAPSLFSLRSTRCHAIPISSNWTTEGARCERIAKRPAVSFVVIFVRLFTRLCLLNQRNENVKSWNRIRKEKRPTKFHRTTSMFCNFEGQASKLRPSMVLRTIREIRNSRANLLSGTILSTDGQRATLPINSSGRRNSANKRGWQSEGG